MKLIVRIIGNIVFHNVLSVKFVSEIQTKVSMFLV